jgi:hypothetical protein
MHVPEVKGFAEKATVLYNHNTYILCYGHQYDYVFCMSVDREAWFSMNIFALQIASNSSVKVDV